MHDVHTRTRLAPPFTAARTLCRFRFQRRFVTLCAWLMRLPNCGPRPQTSHTFAIKQGSPRILRNYSVPRPSQPSQLAHAMTCCANDAISGCSAKWGLARISPLLRNFVPVPALPYGICRPCGITLAPLGAIFVGEVGHGSWNRRLSFSSLIFFTSNLGLRSYVSRPLISCSTSVSWV